MRIAFFLFFLITQSYAWHSPDSFRSGYVEIEEGIDADNIRTSFKDAKDQLSSKLVDIILNDKKNRVDDTFIIPDYFHDSVYFWFSIYSQYTSEQVVIHDMQNLDIIYKVIDFRDIFSSGLNRFAKANLKSKLSLEYTRKLRKVLKYLSTANFGKLNTEQYDVLRLLRKAKVKIPKNRKRRKKFFRNLAKNIRAQSGQRDMIYQGIVRSAPYFPYLLSKISLFKLPREILSIPFLESSFNPKAVSKVDAAGIWQFMKYTNNLFMPKKTRVIDYRVNPFIATLGAMHLLKENRLILRRWDMAITAYNSGTSNLVKARKKYRKKKKLDLAYVLRNYKSKSLGFASKNFYSEFLALAHTLAYKDIIYPLEGLEKQMKNLNSKVHVYVSKCRIRPNKFFKLLKKSSPHIEDLNKHFLKPKRRYPRGVLVVSDVNLTSKRYYKLSDKELKSVFPKKYSRYIRKKKCGKR